MQIDLRGRLALVTGSTSGIGHGIARRLAAQGCGILLHGVERLAAIEALAAEMRAAYGVAALAVSADLSRPEGVAALVDFTTEAGGADILVNNAGVQHVAPIEDFPLEKWDLLLALHLTAPFLLTRALLPEMRRRHWGRIVNIASVHGLVASAEKSAYVAAKHGLVGFTKVVALETAGEGITCNAICPGWVRTPLVEAQISARAEREGLSEERARIALVGEKQPSEEFVSVEQLGAFVAFLCSEHGAGMTGSVLPMDGGWTAQ